MKAFVRWACAAALVCVSSVAGAQNFYREVVEVEGRRIAEVQDMTGVTITGVEYIRSADALDDGGVVGRVGAIVRADACATPHAGVKHDSPAEDRMAAMRYIQSQMTLSELVFSWAFQLPVVVLYSTGGQSFVPSISGDPVPGAPWGSPNETPRCG